MDIVSIDNEWVSLEEITPQPIEIQQTLPIVNNNIVKNEHKVKKFFLNQCYSKIRSHLSIFISILFVSLSILIGILVICLTPRPQIESSCSLKFTSINSFKSQYDSFPQSLALADFNNDYNIDIVIANTNNDNIEIFINNNNQTYISQITYSTDINSHPYSVTVSDLNNDTFIDIIVANYGTHTFGIFYGYGNNTFNNQKTFSTDSSRPRQVIVGDINNDYYLDIIILNDGTHDISIYIGNNNNFYSFYRRYSTGYDSLPCFINFIDINNDQQLDILVANNGTGSIGIFLGNKNGLFSEQIIYSMGIQSYPYAIGVGDFNHNNKTDFVVTKYGINEIEIFLDFNNETFVNRIKLSTGNLIPFNIIVGYFNKDNHLDLAILYSLNDSLSLWMGSGTGTFQQGPIYSTGLNSKSSSIAINMLNNDNLIDIAITNRDTNNIGIFYGTYADFYDKQLNSISNSFESKLILMKDINQDNFDDMILLDSTGENIGVLGNRGNGTFTKLIQFSINDDFTISYFILQDFNHDNIMDIILMDTVESQVKIALGLNNGRFKENITYSVSSSDFYQRIVVGDLNNDNTFDFISFGSPMNCHICVLLTYQNGTYSRIPTFLNISSWMPSYLDINDLNNDKNLDIIFSIQDQSGFFVLFGNGNGSFSQEMYYPSTSGDIISSTIITDLNNDNHLDIIALYQNSFLTVSIGYSNGLFYNDVPYALPASTNLQKMIVADLNNDKYLDVIVNDLNSYVITVLYGFGNGILGRMSNYSVSSDFMPTSVAISDINNDKQSDLILVNNNDPTISFFLGYDPGALNNQLTYPTMSSSRPISISVGDLNHDMKDDLIIANYGIGSIEILLGNNETTLFTNKMTYSMGNNSLPKSILLNDFNGDTYLDIAIANYGSDTINILLGFNDGNFGNKSTYSTGSQSGPSSLAIGDLNNDTQLDLVVANYDSDNIGIFFAYDYPGFYNSLDYPTGSNSQPLIIMAGDLNNDTYLDLVVVNQKGGNIGVFLAYNNGSFASQITYSTGLNSNPYQGAIGDVNNDEILDVIVFAYSGALWILYGSGNGSFANPTNVDYEGYIFPTTLAVHDLDNDNRLDLITNSGFGGNIIIFWGYGNGTFESQTVTSAGASSGITSIVIDDLNGDNNMDFVVLGTYTGVSILFGYGNRTFINDKTYSTNMFGVLRIEVVIGDINNDNKNDMIVLNTFSTDQPEEIYLFFGVADGSFQNSIKDFTNYNSGSASLNIGDFNNDKNLDITFDNKGIDAIVILLGTGDGSFSHRLTYPRSQSDAESDLILADFNHDKQLDIASVNRGSNTMSVFLGYCCNPFFNQVTYSTGLNSNPNSIVIIDFNNDKQLDIIVANEGTNNIGFFQGFNNGNLTNQTILSIYSGSQPYSIVVIDVDNDHCLDIIVTNHGSESISILFSNCNGSIQSEIIYMIGLGSRPYSIVIHDFNNDTIIDIAVSNDGTNNLGILYGYRNGSFTNVNTFSTGYNSLPRSLAVLDFNNDLSTDIAVAMTGTNNIKILSKSCS
ncbi:unnamed protein product [Adineta steineri]|uniref:FG-GAP repeat protein n=1 Tax=Adineta steineri TaxID=433720 RepID=A0A819TJH4_9BILA|nr:unnamed protein product [Adineta steineri]CAF4088740.1 unnamed protein product [Adineta steineri]